MPSGARPRTESAQATITTPTAARIGAAKRSRTVVQEAPPHGSAGPTPVRKRRATKIGALTRLNQGAPTVARDPPLTSTITG